MRQVLSRALALSFATMFLGACTDHVVDPIEDSPALRIEPRCTLGCGDPDPSPNAPGLWFGSGVTPVECFEGDHTDADTDGLFDFCEKHLAYGFRPEIYFAHWADVSRESYWVARPLGDLDEPVRIGFLLGYYADHGNDIWPCTVFPYKWECMGHAGDSEAIFLDVAYDGSTQHWVLHAAHLSAHGDWNDAERGSRDSYLRYYRMIPRLPVFYPTSPPGGYPRVWVAEGKHANYFSEDQCDAGGFQGSDHCDDVDTAARVSAGAYQNVGSRSYHLLSCVEAYNPMHPHYGSGREECFWDPTERFRGWYPLSVGGVDASPYSEVLAAQGF